MPGSDQNINYQIRPSKSIERKMMCELVKEIQIIQGTSELRYIGMGAKYFTDFLLFHNEFGVTDMISIEAERERAMRYEFNKPLKSIQMIYGTTNEVLPQIDQFEEKMNLVWLDYDGAFSEGMLSDIETLCRRLYVGSMFFISCNYSFAGKASEKRSAFEKSVGDYFEPDIEKSRYTNNGIPLIIQELINNLILTLACAAGVAAMKYYKEHDIEGHVAEMHEIVAPFMDEMVKKHKCIGEARCIGLFGALEVVKNKETREPMQEYGVPGPVMPWIFAELKKRGFATFGRENFIEICPPLIITKEELEEYLPILDEVLTMVDEKFCD